MSDYLPEESYNPDTGEYSSFNFQPVFSVRVEIAPDVFATIETQRIDMTPFSNDIVSKLQQLIDRGEFDIIGNRNPNLYPTIPEDFDIQDKNVRGPFIDTPSVERFLDESGLRGIAEAFYDPEFDEYWIDVNTG